jgi:hypothetical protein
MAVEYKRLFESKKSAVEGFKAKAKSNQVEAELMKDKAVANRIKNQANRPKPRIKT